MAEPSTPAAEPDPLARAAPTEGVADVAGVGGDAAAASAAAERLARGTRPPEGGTPRDEEREILASLDAGHHRRALSLLMQTYGTAVYQHCRLQLHDAEIARDVHQEVFLSAYRALPGFARRSSLRTWLIGIAQHRCLDAARARQRVRRRHEEAAREPEPVAAVAPDTRELQDRARALEDCLGGLAPEVRLAVLQRHREDLAYEEMASLWNVKVETLRVRVSRALKALRACLSSKGIEP